MRRIGALGALGLVLGMAGCAGVNRRVVSTPAGPGGTIPGTVATAAGPARLETNRWARARRPTWPASDRPAAATNRPPEALSRFFPGLSRDAEGARPTLIAGGGHDHRHEGQSLVDGPRGLPVESRDLPPALPVTLTVKVAPDPMPAVAAASAPADSIAARSGHRDTDARRVRIEEEARPEPPAAPDPMPAEPSAEASSPSPAAPGPPLVPTENLPSPELPSPELPETEAAIPANPAMPEVAPVADSSIALPTPVEVPAVPSEPDPVPVEPPPVVEPPAPVEPSPAVEPPPAEEPTTADVLPEEPPAVETSEVSEPADDMPVEPATTAPTARDTVLAGRPRLKSYPTVNATPAPAADPAPASSKPTRVREISPLPPIRFPATYYPPSPSDRPGPPGTSASAPARPRRSLIGRLRDRWHARDVQEVKQTSSEVAVGVGVAPRGE